MVKPVVTCDHPRLSVSEALTIMGLKHETLAAEWRAECERARLAIAEAAERSK